jgi:hypothetical protein
MSPKRSQDDAYRELRRHLDTVKEIDEKVASKKQHLKWAGSLAFAAVSGHPAYLMIIGTSVMARDYQRAKDGIDKIFHEYPELEKSYSGGAALVEMESMKRQFLGKGKSKDMPKLGKRQHVRVRQHGERFDADDGDGYDYHDLTADECYRTFIQGTNRVCETGDGWVHFWRESK